MKLNKVIINNFRNITFAEYDLEKINIFAGPNKQGKTNTIIAIYWAITNYLLDGSSDIASLKPLDDTKKEVSVELIFDDFKIKKVFYENWVKTRGTDIVTMSGHFTDYYINDIKTKNGEAILEINKAFGVDSELNNSKFDLLQAMINPYYISKVDWKELRKFIISLIGDVSNEDVFEANNLLTSIKERLETDGFDTSKTVKYYNTNITECKKTTNEIAGKIKGLEDMKDVNDSDFKQANKMLETIEEQKYSIKNNNDSKFKEARIALVNELTELQNSYQTARKHDAEKLVEINKSSNDLFDKYTKEITEEKQKAATLRSELNNNENQLMELLSDINRKKHDLEMKKQERDRLYAAYDEESVRKIVKSAGVSVEAITCPNCNHVLNQDSISKANESIEKAYQAELTNHSKKLDSIIANGKETTLTIDNLTKNIEVLERNIKPTESKSNELKEELKNVDKKIDNLETFINVERNNIKYVFESDTTKTILLKINDIEEQIKSLDKADNSETDKQAKLYELEESKKQYQAIVNDRNTYISAQKHIAELQKQLDDIGNQQMTHEQNLLLVNEFTLTKLNMFNKHVSEVFKDRVKFTLIENNIKEGSWNEVCYPSVLDKDTPFTNGSGSEQILTGIYLIECIKNKLSIPSSLYIFDECDKLDTKSLASIETQSQLITTKVDDVNYKEIILEKRGN